MVGRGDYSITEPELNNLKQQIDRIDQKIPDIRGGIRKAAPAIGTAIGGYFGNPAAGASMGSGLSKLLGFGDYTISSNSLLKLPHGDQAAIVPTFGQKNNAVRVREREYIGEVVSSATPSAFKNTSYSINPLAAGTFPWLSRMASLFDEWEPHGIVFEFVSTSSEYNGASQALGSVVLATDYNAADPPFPTKQAMENSDFANATKPSNSACHGIECDPNQRPTKLLYTSSSGSLTPINMISMGNFQLSSTGVSVANVTLGELWVSYDISFYKRVVDLQDSLWVQYTGSMTAGASPFGTPILNPLSSALFPLSVIVGVSATIAFPVLQSEQRYLLCTYVVTGLPPPEIADTNCQVVATRTSAATPSISNRVIVVPAGAIASLTYGVAVSTTAYSYSMTAVPANFTF